MSDKAAILIVGAGKSGLAAASLAIRSGFAVQLADDNAEPEVLPEGVEFAVPSDLAAAAEFPFARVVASPGVPRDHALFARAVAAGVEVVSELAFAAEQVEARITGITGTNGKSTVVSLVGAICECAGRKTFVGGNLGNPLSEAAGRDLDECIVEVSSFQLEWPGAFHPAIGAVLNVSPDHLDRHGTFEAYVDAKMQLFARMTENDRAVFGRDQRWWLDRRPEIAAQISTFGVEAYYAGEGGTRVDRDARRIERIDGQGEPFTVSLAEAWPLAPHDFDNAAAAVEIAALLGIDRDSIERGLVEFEPLPHRLARVRGVGGVEYWNDSKATNAGAARRALEAFDQPVILLAGGALKGASFAELSLAAAHIKRLVAYGEAASAIEAELAGEIPVERAGSLEEAVAAAAAIAETGDVVLLAPACASFDEFRSYAERGERFEALVEEMARGGA